MYVTANRRKHNLAWVIKIYNNDNNNNNIFFLIASLQITREQLSRKQKHQQQSDVFKDIHHFLQSQQRICVNTQNLIRVLYVKIGNDYFIQ